MTTTIRLMSDWGFYPFYVNRGDGSFAMTQPGPFQADFRLPEHVMRALLDWDQTYQDLIDWDDPAGSGWENPADEQRYLDAGRAAARLLREHVPADVRIEYTGADSIASEYY